MTIRPRRLWPAVLLTAGAARPRRLRLAATDRVVIGVERSGRRRIGGGVGVRLGAAGEPGQVTITVTEADGCVATPNTVPAGQVTFVVTNVDAVGVTEVELVVRPADRRRAGEPGARLRQHVLGPAGRRQLSRSTARAPPPSEQPFTVTGEAAAQDRPTSTALLNQATIDYAAYVDDQISFLLAAGAGAGGRDQGRRPGRGAGRLHQGPAVLRADRAGGRVVPRPGPGDRPARRRRRGRAPPGPGSTRSSRACSRSRAPRDSASWPTSWSSTSQSLQTQAAAAVRRDQRPAPPAATRRSRSPTAPSGLLDEVLASKITGEEEAYSKIDLLDFEANVEGSLQAFATLKPALDQIDPTLVPQISAAFDALTAELAKYQDPTSPSGWTPYDQLTAADKKALTDALLAVQEPLSAISAQKITQLSRSSGQDDERAGHVPAAVPRRSRRRRRWAGGRRRRRRRATASGRPPTRTPTQRPVRGHRRTPMPPANAIVPFYGERQAGITTAQQERLMFAALDVTTTDVEELQRMLGRWAAMAARITAGQAGQRLAGPRPEQPPFDTGEAMDLGPHSLTITVGFGPSLFDDRFGLADRMPAELTPFGTIPGDAVMKPATLRRRPVHPGLRGRPAGGLPRHPQHGPGGPRHRRAEVVAARLRPGVGDRRRPDHAAQPDGLQGRHQQHPRRRHRDAGRAGLGRRERGDRRRARWMAGGSYLVARKIRMEIESWDTDPLDRPGADLRPDQDHRRPAHRRRRVHPVRLRQGRPTPASRSSTSMRTSGWRRRSRTAASGSCAAATTTPTGRTRTPASSPPGCSSSPSSATRRPSSRCCRPGSASPTCSTSTSRTSAAGCGPARPASAVRATGSARPCSA